MSSIKELRRKVALERSRIAKEKEKRRLKSELFAMKHRKVIKVAKFIGKTSQNLAKSATKASKRRGYKGFFGDYNL